MKWRIAKRAGLWLLGSALKRRRDRLDKEEMSLCMAVNEEHPVFRGMMAILDEQIEQASDMVGDADVAREPQWLAHTAGGLDWLKQTRRIAEEIRAQSIARTEGGG